MRQNYCYSPLLQDRFGIDIFFAFARRNSAKPIDARDKMAAVRNMKLYAFALGNDAVWPAISKVD